MTISSSPGDIGSLSQQYDDGSANASTSTDPQDPMVNTGKRIRKTPYTADNLQFMAGSKRVPDPGVPAPQKKSDAMKDFYRLDDKQIKPLQFRLWQAGYFGSLRWDQVKQGTHDPMTAKAYSEALDNTAAQNQANPDKSVDDIINEEATANQELQQQQLNPDQIRSNLKAVAPGVIGHPLDDATAGLIVPKAQAAASSYGSAPDQSWYEDQIRQMLPEASKANTEFGNIGTFLKMVDPQGAFSAYHQ